MQIWIPDTSPSKDKQDYVSEIVTNTFPYLDLEFLLNADEALEYQVHQNQINNLSILIKVVLTLMQPSMQFQAAYFTGLRT